MPFKSSARGSYGPQGQKVIKGPLAPVWTTFSPGAVGTETFSYTFVATDDSGDVPTYSVASGSLPTGLTLNSSTGVLSGTATTSGTFTYTLRATDVNGRFTDTTSISQVVSLVLYTFSSATFTTGGVTGRDGPNITQARSGLGNPSWASTYLNMTNNGIQRWTVPGTGNYSFIVAGARGGNDGQAGGAGRIITGNVSLTQGEILNIVCGQPGQDNGGNGGGGGGGGSFVYSGGSVSYSDSDLLFAAGGGGGANSGGSGFTGEDGLNSNRASGGKDNYQNAANRLATPASLGYGGNMASENNYGAAGGAGFLGNGASGNQGYAGGSSGASGWTGGPTGPGINMVGGFGGGSGCMQDCGGSGAGGGYTGGGGASCYSTSGGGGSKHGTRVTSAVFGSTNAGSGYVTITKL